MIWKKNESDPNEPSTTDLLTLPLLPLRDIVVFPYMVIPLFVGRDKSIAALQEAMAGDKEIFLSAQRSAKTNDPGEDDIFEVGTISLVMQMLRLIPTQPWIPCWRGQKRKWTRRSSAQECKLSLHYGRMEDLSDGKPPRSGPTSPTGCMITVS